MPELESLTYCINNEDNSLKKLFNNVQVVWIKQVKICEILQVEHCYFILNYHC